jgi:opacity protein-like surface antigen
MKRRFVTAILASAAVCASLTAREARAQELQLTGPLKGAPAVRDMRLYREGRLELAPTVSFTLLDEYRRTILVGARLNYNIKDWLAIGVWGAYGVVSLTTNLTDQIDQVAPRDALTVTNVNHTGTYPNYGTAPFADQTAKLNYVLAPQLTFIPFRGKLAIFNKIFVDADFYASGGVAFVGIQERENCGSAGQPSCADPSSFALQSQTKIAPTFAAGFTFFPGDFWSIGVEYRALPFSWNRAGFDCCGAGTNGNFPDGKITSADDTFDFNQMVTLSVGFYFDMGNGFTTKPRISE